MEINGKELSFRWIKEVAARNWKERKEKSLSHVRLCDPVDCSLPGSSVHGIFRARVLECVAISFSRGSSRPRYRTWVSLMAVDSLPSKAPGKPSSIWGIPYLFKVFLSNRHTGLWTIFTQAMFIISQISVLISKAVKKFVSNVFQRKILFQIFFWDIKNIDVSNSPVSCQTCYYQIIYLLIPKSSLILEFP